MRRSLDVLLLFILLTARLRLNAFAESSLFEHIQNIASHPLLGKIVSKEAFDAFGPYLGDPIFLLLAAISLLAFLAYAVTDMLTDRMKKRTVFLTKYALLWLIILALAILPTIKLTLLRHDNLPHSYSHDGGVLQTEAAIDYFLEGRNPYAESYQDTPMADWGFPEFRTALDHYPYLPATFVLSAPIKLLSETNLGWYDQRFTYLLLFILILFLIPSLVQKQPEAALGLTMVLALNPIMGLDILFGQNDLFVLAWIVFSFWFLQRRKFVWSSIFFGLACAAKPTAWFLAPFWSVALLADQNIPWKSFHRYIPRLLRRLAPAIVIFLLFTLPYLFWNADAFVDDVWRWAAGTAKIHYQIWGLGFANYILATGSLADRFAYWPFWIPELLVSVPLLVFLLSRQLRDNTVSSVYWHGAIFLLGFSYFSRFLNENYLGFILALFALGFFINSHHAASE
ncbi:MAG TPA: DUF2029 domain-containing protein [Caldilineae bacterium]|nr:DUF2029 domain-containing protein [Caldilineae bacterium]